VANAWGRPPAGAGDVVVLTHMEHHANIVPWPFWPPAASSCAGSPSPPTAPRPTDLPRLLDGGPGCLGVTAGPNVLGTINDIAPRAEAAHAAGALLVWSTAAQAVPHLDHRRRPPSAPTSWPLRPQDARCSARRHRALWARRELLEAMAGPSSAAAI